MRRELPRKLSSLLRIAVEDSRMVSEIPDFQLYMQEWYSANGKCRVCMAGAVMLVSGGVRPEHDMTCWEELSNSKEAGHLKELMSAIDKGRRGLLVGAARQLGGSPRFDQVLVLEILERRIRSNFDSVLGHAPWDVYLSVCDRLKEVGF